MGADAVISYAPVRHAPTARHERDSQHVASEPGAHAMPRPVNGFTLIEALVVMTVAAILLAVAIPAWSHAKAAANAGSVRADLAASLLDAGRHSAIAGSEVVVCPATASGECSGSTNWDDGWLAFADINGDRSPRHQRNAAGRCQGAAGRNPPAHHRGSNAAAFSAQWRKRGIECDVHAVRRPGIGQRDNAGSIQFRQFPHRQADGERRLGLRLREVSRSAV